MSQDRTHHVHVPVTAEHVEEMVDALVPMMVKELVQMPIDIAQERAQHHHVERYVDVPVHMTQTEIIHVPKVIAQECAQHHNDEQYVDVSVLRTQEEIVHVPKGLTLESAQRRRVEQSVDVPVSVMKLAKTHGHMTSAPTWSPFEFLQQQDCAHMRAACRRSWTCVAAWTPIGENDDGEYDDGDLNEDDDRRGS